MSSALAVLLGSLFLVASAFGFVWLFHPPKYRTLELAPRESVRPEPIEPSGYRPIPAAIKARQRVEWAEGEDAKDRHAARWMPQDAAEWARLEAVDEAARP